MNSWARTAESGEPNKSLDLFVLASSEFERAKLHAESDEFDVVVYL